jgi:TatD DNase family protein
LTSLIDSHSHIYDKAFAGDLPEALANAANANLSKIVVCGDDVPSSVAAVAMALEHDIVIPTVGIHPHGSRDADDASIAEIRRLALLPDVAAVGEIGLDFYRDLSPRDVQLAALEAQLNIAIEVEKPVCIHSRSAEDVIAQPLAVFARNSTLPGQGRAIGVMHCFGGTLEQAQRYVDIGFLISLACVVTYPNNDQSRRIAMELPLGALLIETDSPYLPPHHLRGRRNEPANVTFAVQAIADARGCTFDEVATATTYNAASLFGTEVGTESVA